MALRPDNHITGDVAVNYIKTHLLPREWVANDYKIDYGLDLNVDIFTNHQSTGLSFCIQSKGTEKSVGNSEISYEMPMARLQDYSEQTRPVLVVYFSEPDNVFFGVWANGIYGWLSEEQRKQKSCSIRFGKRNIINTALLEAIAPTIKLDLIKRIDVRTNSASEFEPLHNQLFSLLDKTYPNHFTLGNGLAAKAIYFDYEKTKEGIAIRVNGNNECIVIPAGEVDEAYAWYMDVNVQESPFFIQVLVATIGMVYVNKHDERFPYPIYTRDIIDELLYIVPERYWLDWVSYMPVGELDILRQLLNVSFVTNHRTIAQYVMLALLLRKEPAVNEIRERLQRMMLSFETNPEDKGRWCYNIANQIRSENPYEAASLYFQAQRYFSTYREVYYWWKELAGVLFMSGHYAWSQKYYEKACSLINLKEEKQDIIELIADTCLYQKDIEQAMSWLDKYIELCAEQHKSVPEKIGLQIKAYQYYKDLREQGQKIHASGEDWHAEGMASQKDELWGKAKMEFVIAWAYERDNICPLAGALAMSINTGDMMLCALIVRTVQTLFGKDEINWLIKEISKWQLSEKSKQRLMGLMSGKIKIK